MKTMNFHVNSCPLTVVLFLVAATAAFYCSTPDNEPKIIEQVDIEKVWSGHPVGFSLLTHHDQQFVVYYNEKREMTVASRKLNEANWTIQRLPSQLGWDSHNSVTITLDSDYCLHISGNMHNQPLVYFRSEKPLDVTSIKPVHRMTEEAENKVTYPAFMHDHDGRLLFMYRNGSSGDGERLVNVYDEESKSWKRLLQTPLLNGRAHSMNAYPSGPPVKGPDGYFHLLWMWRDTPDARSNHDISYARSRDFVNWETASGAYVTLPITPDNKEVIVDPVSTQNGLINVGHYVSFDPDDRAIISYHKYDTKGNSQIFLARWEENTWNVRPASSWQTRWDFGGNGAILIDILAKPLVILPDGRLVQSWRNKKHGEGTWELDPQTLMVIGDAEIPPSVPKHLMTSASNFEGMTVQWSDDINIGTHSDAVQYRLRWETLPFNRDRPRSGPLPEASMLRVYKIQVD